MEGFLTCREFFMGEFGVQRLRQFYVVGVMPNRRNFGSVAKNPVMGERALVIFGEISDERFQVAPLSG